LDDVQHDATVASAESLEVGSRVHVGDGNCRAAADAADVGPAGFDIVDRGHIRHGTARRQIGKNHLLLRPAQDIGALGHKVDAAEQDVFRFVARRGQLAQLERVAPKVGILDDFVTLVVVAEDDESRTQLALGVPDLSIQFGLAKPGIGSGQAFLTGPLGCLPLRHATAVEGFFGRRQVIAGTEHRALSSHARRSAAEASSPRGCRCSPALVAH